MYFEINSGNHYDRIEGYLKELCKLQLDTLRYIKFIAMILERQQPTDSIIDEINV